MISVKNFGVDIRDVVGFYTRPVSQLFSYQKKEYGIFILLKSGRKIMAVTFATEKERDEAVDKVFGKVSELGYRDKSL